MDIATELQSTLPKSLVNNLLNEFRIQVREHRSGNWRESLNASGMFVEHSFRALHYLQTAKLVPEIKNQTKLSAQLEADMNLPESVRMTIPRVLRGLPYNIRSKKGGAHVKGISPDQIDSSLTVLASSWVLAELLRLYHSADESSIASAMTDLTQRQIPLIEEVAGDIVVSQKTTCRNEILLLLAHAHPNGLSRKELGEQVEGFSHQNISSSLSRLRAARSIHQHRTDNRFYLLQSGWREVDEVIAKNVGI